jgi:hypothetical protein
MLGAGQLNGRHCREGKRMLAFAFLVARGRMRVSIEPEQNVLVAKDVVG